MASEITDACALHRPAAPLPGAVVVWTWPVHPQCLNGVAPAQQLAEAASVWRALVHHAWQQPDQARRAAEALTGQLLAHLVGAPDLWVRLATERAGDPASTHAVVVCVVSLWLGRSVGLSDAELLDLGVGALLHDIGDAEWPEHRHHIELRGDPGHPKAAAAHIERGIHMARRMGLTPSASLVIAQHHEHSDGSGYPLCLKNDRTTVQSRIVSMVNAFDEWCHPVHPVKALQLRAPSTPCDAVAQLFSLRKTKFDTPLVEAFVKAIGVYPAGSVVQLTDDRYALVVAVNAARPLLPQVVVHEPAVPRERAVVLDLAQAAGLGIRCALKPTAVPDSTLDYLTPAVRAVYYFEQPTRAGAAA